MTVVYEGGHNYTFFKMSQTQYALMFIMVDNKVLPCCFILINTTYTLSRKFVSAIMV